jgi:hypothetical protein
LSKRKQWHSRKLQSDSWYEQYHWYMEYSLSECVASIYMLPYISNGYQLMLYTNDLLNKLDELNRFCTVFSNIEQRDCLLFILQHLSKLLYLNVHSRISTFRDEIS